MTNILRPAGKMLTKLGLSIKGSIPFYKDLRLIKAQMNESKKDFPFGKLFPILRDRYLESGLAKGDYFHQDLLMAKRVFANKPVTHVDVGSRVDGFVAHVASFREIEVFDIRPLPSNTISNLKFMQADFMAPLDPKYHDYSDSLSCLHALEHFGLGRYGDPINYNGHLLGLENLGKLLKSGGKFYFSVPIGPQRIEFNAHRVFSVSYLLGLFEGKYKLDQFSYVDDHGDLHEDVPVTEASIKSNFECNFGIGLFEMTKL